MTEPKIPSLSHFSRRTLEHYHRQWLQQMTTLSCLQNKFHLFLDTDVVNDPTSELKLRAMTLSNEIIEELYYAKRASNPTSTFPALQERKQKWQALKSAAQSAQTKRLGFPL